VKRLRRYAFGGPAALRLFGAAVGVVVFSLACFVPTASVRTSVPSVAAAPPGGRDRTPDALDQICIPRRPGVIWGTDEDDRRSDRNPGDVICALRGNDTITVKHAGTIVWAGPGNDRIRMKNRVPNELWAGTGRDSARADSTDRSHNLESSYRFLNVRRAASPTLRASAQGWKYPAYQPRIQCVIQDGQRRLLIDPPPELRAVDRSRLVDWQSVAWSPVLTWWNGREWEFVVQNDWLWDRTYDEQVRSFPGNVWRRFDTSERWRLWFYANRGGYFRVAVYYFHYAEGNVPANRIYAWVDEHRGPFAARDGRSCQFR
jgi:hypothetical protein